MSRNIIIFLIVLVSEANAQNMYVSPDGFVTYDSVINLDGMKAEDIFGKTKSWFVEYFKSAKNVIQGENSPELIKGTFIERYLAAMGTTQKYTNDITIKIKNGKMKVIIDNFQTASGASPIPIETITVKDGQMKMNGLYGKLFKDIDSKCDNLVDNLVTYITEKSDF